MTKKEEWVNEVLQSLGEIHLAQPSAELYNRIAQQTFAGAEIDIFSRGVLKWLIAASIVVALNAYVISSKVLSSDDSQTIEDSQNKIITDYTLY